MGEQPQLGFYTAEELSNDNYHSGPGVSNSGLKLIGDRTPAHFKARYIDRTARDSSTRAKFIGTAIHAAALEPGRFAEAYAEPLVLPPGALVTADDMKPILKAAGEKISGSKSELIERVLAIKPDAVIADVIKAEYQRANAGKLILSADEFAKVEGMRKALHSHPEAAALLADAFEFEYSAYAIDPATGLLVRMRMDLMTEGGWMADLKKCQDASAAGAAQAMANYGYYHQDAFYTDVFRWAAGEDPAGMKFIFVEEEPPHAVAVYTLHEDDRQRGRDQYRRNLDLYARCLERDEWPAYSERAEVVELPRWKRAQIDSQIFNHVE